MSDAAAGFELIETIQDGGSHGGGNQLFRYGCEGAGDRLLKVYRARGSRWRLWWKTLSHRLVERKRGTRAVDRYRVEKVSLELWNEHGFDVPALYEDPVPREHAAHHALWMEFVPGPSVADMLEDDAVTNGEKRNLIERLAEMVCRRHALAVELNETLLVPEHASVKHVLVSGDRLVSFDLEGGYLPSLPVLEALTQEVSSTLRSIARKAENQFDELFVTFVSHYPDPDLLGRIARYGLASRGIYRRFKRLQDERRRPQFSKTGMLARILRSLPASSASRH